MSQYFYATGGKWIICHLKKEKLLVNSYTASTKKIQNDHSPTFEKNSINATDDADNDNSGEHPLKAYVLGTKHVAQEVGTIIIGPIFQRKAHKVKSLIEGYTAIK